MKSRNILQQVKNTYSAIAKEFDASRDREWPEFSVFLKHMVQKSDMAFGSTRSESSPRIHDTRALFRQTLAETKPIRLLDIGCGNGRLSRFLKPYPVEYIGIDNNKEFVRIAKKKNLKSKFRLADTLKLPFSKNSFDSVWMIAVLHHLPTEKLRMQALKEIKKVLKKNGTLMLTVWNLLPQKKYRKYIDPKTHDAEIPWGKEKKWMRYYHAFTIPELTALISGAGFSMVKKIRNARNLAIIAKKI